VVANQRADPSYVAMLQVCKESPAALETSAGVEALARRNAVAAS
jgi:hypothetical protein